MTKSREKFIQKVLSGLSTLDLLGFAKEFEGNNTAAHKRIIVELSKRPGALNALQAV